MSSTNNQTVFTRADLESWLAEGIITPDQATRIREQVPPSAPFVAPPPVRWQVKPPDTVTFAYYAGGFLTLFAFTYFIVMNWTSFGQTGQSLISIFSVAAIGGVGFLLRRAGLILGGDMLIFVASCLVSWAVYNFARMVGVWPSEPSGYVSYEAYATYQVMLRPLWVALEFISIAAAVAAFRLTRFPLIAIPIVFWSWCFALDITRLFAHSTLAGYGNLEEIVTIIFGVALLTVGIYLQRRTTPDYSDWFYTVGHLAVFINVTSFIISADVTVGLIFLPLYFAFLVASIWLQRRIFLASAALNFYIYITYLAYETLYTSSNFALTMALVGLIIILSTAFYQRYVHPWLKTQLSRYGELG